MNPPIHQTPSPISNPRRRPRAGTTLIELVVSAAVLMTIMSFVTTLCVRVNWVWKDIGHRRVAVGELSNQLERLTRLTPRQANQELDSLEASDLCRQTLKLPQLNGTLVDDELGFRIVLQLNWQRRYPGTPVELVGWLQHDDAPDPSGALWHPTVPENDHRLGARDTQRTNLASQQEALQ